MMWKVAGPASARVEVAEAGPDDAEALADVAARSFPLACPPSLTSADIAAFVEANLSADRFRGYLTEPDRAVLAARSGTDLVGYAMLVRHPTGRSVGAVVDAPVAELSKMYLLSDWHGTGAAAAVMTGALARARRWHATAVWLGVNQANRRAQRFYAKHGFVVSGTRTFRVGAATEHDFVMSRRLDPPAA